jgi:hypothetical protein
MNEYAYHFNGCGRLEQVKYFTPNKNYAEAMVEDTREGVRKSSAIRIEVASSNIISSER